MEPLEELLARALPTRELGPTDLLPELGDYDEARETRRARKYGLAPSGVPGMLLSQNCRCAICGKAITLHAAEVDHDHLTGKVRELLCSSCNTGLGMFADSRLTLLSALRYLERHAERT